MTGTATDLAGFSASTTVVVNIDETPPVLVVTSPANGAVVNTGSLTVSGTATDALSGIASLTCQGTAAVRSGSNFTCVVPIVPGPNVIVVQGADQAGNTAQESLTVQGGVPAILTVVPGGGQQGQQNESVSLTGQFTHWVQAGKHVYQENFSPSSTRGA
ncbi:MAG: Ig-like domain-containing protein [Bryobacteraceae bacterium]